MGRPPLQPGEWGWQLGLGEAKTSLRIGSYTLKTKLTAFVGGFDEGKHSQG